MSHLSDIGFVVNNPEEMARLFFDFKKTCKRQVSDKFVQYVLEDKSGARLYWLFKKVGLFGKEEFVSFIPSFKGDLVQRIRAPKLKPNQKSPLEPSLDLWITDPEENQEYPLIVDISNYLEVKDTDFSKLGSIRVVLFADSFEYFENKNEFNVRYPRKSEHQFPSPGMFIPTGTFSPKNNPDFIQHAACWCYGEVIKSATLLNQLTGKEFFHFIMKTYAATYDVVTEANEKINLKKVGIIGGEFWPCAIV